MSGLGASRGLWWGAGAAALLMVAGGAAFTYAAARAPASPKADALTVTLRDGVCQPNSLSVPEGRATFRIVNETDRAVEWEILDGVMVVEERENIAPGLTQTLSAKLSPGTFAITCGLLSNPRGTLTVTASADGAAKAPDLVAYVAPLAEYQVYSTLQASAFAKSARALTEAVAANDPEGARTALASARAAYAKLAPVAGRFSDLANTINPRAAYLAGRETDPAFTGLDRVGLGLKTDTLDGLGPVAAKLAADADALKERLRALRLAPGDLSAGAARAAHSLADALAGDDADASGGSARADADATLAGLNKIVGLLAPVVSQSASQAAGDATAALDAARAALGGPGAAWDAAARERASKAVRALAEALGQLDDAVGSPVGGASAGSTGAAT